MFRIFKTVLLPAVMVMALFVIPSDRTSAQEPQLTGNVPDSGVALVLWSGGTVDELLPVARNQGCYINSLWTSDAGSLVGYVVGAPAFVNVGFLDLFGGATLPPSTALILVCAPKLSSVSVMGTWDAGDDRDRFEAMVAPWEGLTGSGMDYTGTRDLTALLTIRVAAGNPPDIAIPPEFGLFQDFARQGELVPLSACNLDDLVRARYPEGFVELGTVDGKLYGFFIKADNKDTVWYNPKLFAAQGWEPLTADSSWSDLIALSDEILADGFTPWSMGVGSGEASGWPGSDWIQQIILAEDDGREVYDGLIDGSVAWTDPRVKQAWQRFGQIALTEGYVAQGGGSGINATTFVESTYLPFEAPPQAAMVFLGGFAAGFIADEFPNLVAVEDYDFFPFPGAGITGGGHIVFAFNDDEATCLLMQHLASAEAQQIWVGLGGFTSVNQEVSLDAYPDPVSRALAEQLTQAERFRGDLDDTIGGARQQAIWAGVIDYLANPADLDAILEQIEATP